MGVGWRLAVAGGVVVDGKSDVVVEVAVVEDVVESNGVGSVVGIAGETVVELELGVVVVVVSVGFEGR